MITDEYGIVQGIITLNDILEALVGDAADFYEEEVDNLVDNLSSLMEPIIMVILGILVGGLIVAMYLPIFKMASVVG